jgi:hypothetical protein
MHWIVESLRMSGVMTWDILWGLILGFLLSAIVQAVVSKEEMTALLPNDRPRTIAVACGLGAASSSCSYAAAALARSMFRKGANFTAAMAFQFASTNLVIELGILLWVLMGWQFTLAEFIGGPLMIIILALLLRWFVSPALVEKAREHAERGVAGRMEGHAAMDMSMHEGSLRHRIFSDKGRTAISHFFFMDWYSLWLDLAGGLLISGVIAALVPASFWKGFFLVGHPIASKLWGPVVGPLVAVLSFVCSIGNVPLAAVLWQGGISFGGVISFLFADLIIFPLLNIYRKYYGARVAALLGVLFYTAMVLAALAIEALFSVLHLIPSHGGVNIMQEGVRWNYTTWLNIVFLLIAASMLPRFLRTGGVAMLRMMGNEHMDHGHAGGHGAEKHCCH